MEHIYLSKLSLKQKESYEHILSQLLECQRNLYKFGEQVIIVYFCFHLIGINLLKVLWVFRLQDDVNTH